MKYLKPTSAGSLYRAVQSCLLLWGTLGLGPCLQLQAAESLPPVSFNKVEIQAVSSAGSKSELVLQVQGTATAQQRLQLSQNELVFLNKFCLKASSNLKIFTPWTANKP